MSEVLNDNIVSLTSRNIYGNWLDTCAIMNVNDPHWKQNASVTEMLEHVAVVYGQRYLEKYLMSLPYHLR